MCLSDTALSVFEKHDQTAAVVEEAKHNMHNYEFSLMMCMFALATVINCTIRPYYPITNDSLPRQDWDSLVKMFNCSIYPRLFLDGDFLENVRIFCCATMPQRYLVNQRYQQGRIILLHCASQLIMSSLVSIIFCPNSRCYHNHQKQLMAMLLLVLFPKWCQLEQNENN